MQTLANCASYRMFSFPLSSTLPPSLPHHHISLSLSLFLLHTHTRYCILQHTTYLIHMDRHYLTYNTTATKTYCHSNICYFTSYLGSTQARCTQSPNTLYYNATHTRYFITQTVSIQKIYTIFLSSNSNTLIYLFL